MMSVLHIVYDPQINLEEPPLFSAPPPKKSFNKSQFLISIMRLDQFKSIMYPVHISVFEDKYFVSKKCFLITWILLKILTEVFFQKVKNIFSFISDENVIFIFLFYFVFKSTTIAEKISSFHFKLFGYFTQENNFVTLEYFYTEILLCVIVLKKFR